MQTKLHRYASEEPSGRFDDLFNLVYDPAFLVYPLTPAFARNQAIVGEKSARATIAETGGD